LCDNKRWVIAVKDAVLYKEEVVLGECLFAEVRFDLLAERSTDSLSRKFRLLKILLQIAGDREQALG